MDPVQGLYTQGGLSVTAAVKPGAPPGKKQIN